jgi:hypothetical protein
MTPAFIGLLIGFAIIVGFELDRRFRILSREMRWYIWDVIYTIRKPEITWWGDFHTYVRQQPIPVIIGIRSGHTAKTRNDFVQVVWEPRIKSWYRWFCYKVGFWSCVVIGILIGAICGYVFYWISTIKGFWL